MIKLMTIGCVVCTYTKASSHYITVTLCPVITIFPAELVLLLKNCYENELCLSIFKLIGPDIKIGGRLMIRKCLWALVTHELPVKFLHYKRNELTL